MALEMRKPGDRGGESPEEQACRRMLVHIVSETQDMMKRSPDAHVHSAMMLLWANLTATLIANGMSREEITTLFEKAVSDVLDAIANDRMPLPVGRVAVKQEDSDDG